MARLANGLGLKYRMGTAFGGSLISLAGAHITAALPHHDGFAEVGEFLHFDDPLHMPANVNDGEFILDDTPGFGQIRRSSVSVFDV